MVFMCFLVVIAYPEARAQVTPASWELTASGATFFDTTNQLSLANSYNDGAYSSSDSVLLTPLNTDPSIGASASGGYAGAATASLTYYLEISGTPGTYVPVDFSASGSLAVNGLSAGGESTYTLQYYGNDGGEITQSAVNTTKSYSTNAVIMLPAGIADIAMVTMYVTVHSSSSQTRTGMALGGVDPTFTIDPSFTSTNSQFSIGYSPNLTTVPEPSPLALGVIGLFAFGLFFLSRRIF